MRLLAVIAVLVMNATAFAQLPRFDIQGHRGARGLKPENSIPAFIAALDSGATTLEMDVVITKDRQVVVSHEPWMSATLCMDSSGIPVTTKNEKKFNLYQMTYEQVRRFDCGSRGHEKFPQQERLSTIKPLLRDVIVTVENHIKSFTRYNVDYSIEVKSEKSADGKFQPSPEEFSDLVYALIDQYLPWDRVVIQSFDFRVLRYWHHRYPTIRLSALVENLKSIDENLKDLGFTPSVYSPEFHLVSREEVGHAHALGMRIIPWTVNDTKIMAELKSWNIDGIITDYPNRAREYQHPPGTRGGK
jgi:glycerophosphoryl diester phosphodiesterase